ncbi:MAG: Ltp family lipoprotein [Eubacteriales bacterium]|nr:Ltp family lipoprotein [Eubacteriales bacterium]
MKKKLVLLSILVTGIIGVTSAANVQAKTLNVSNISVDIPDEWTETKNEIDDDTAIVEYDTGKSTLNVYSVAYDESISELSYILIDSLKSGFEKRDGYSEIYYADNVDVDGKTAHMTSALIKSDILLLFAFDSGKSTINICEIVSSKNYSDEIFDDFEKVLESIDIDPEESGNASNNSTASEIADITLGMKNALSKANRYLELMSFSYSGLIDQLEYAGFTKEEATYAADNCGADWNEQAAKKAKSYLEISAMSRSRLIEQLEYTGFTTEQAEYGAAAVGY